MRREQPNAFTMSFLDIVCSGFGAAIFMYIIFASMPIQQAGGKKGSTDYIQLDVKWNQSSGQTDRTLSIYVKPPNGEFIQLHGQNRSIDPETGRISISGKESQSGAWGVVYTTGLSSTSDGIDDMLIGTKKAASVRIIHPCPGEWKFAVNSQNWSHDTDLGLFNPSHQLEVEAVITTSENIDGEYQKKIDPFTLDYAAILLSFISGSRDLQFEVLKWKSRRNAGGVDVLVLKTEPKGDYPDVCPSV